MQHFYSLLSLQVLVDHVPGPEQANTEEHDQQGLEVTAEIKSVAHDELSDSESAVSSSAVSEPVGQAHARLMGLKEKKQR